MLTVRLFALVSILVLGLFAPSLMAEESKPKPPVDALRDRVTKALITSDAGALHGCLAPDVVVIQPDGTTIKGADAVRDFVAESFAGKSGWFRSVTVEPVIETRLDLADSVAITGRANDVYTLVNGSSLVLDSRFSALVGPVRVADIEDGKSATGAGFVIRQIQIAPAAFDNPIMNAVIKKSANALLWAGFIGATVGGVLVAMIIKFLLRKG